VLDAAEAPDESTIGSKSDLFSLFLCRPRWTLPCRPPENLPYHPTNSCSRTHLISAGSKCQCASPDDRERSYRMVTCPSGRHLAPGGRPEAIEWVESPPSIIRTAKHQFVGVPSFLLEFLFPVPFFPSVIQVGCTCTARPSIADRRAGIFFVICFVRRFWTVFLNQQGEKECLT
jgi:hypothetical protein